MKILDIPESGKCGLTVTWRGRAGLLRRAYVVPRNPDTLAQRIVRTNLTSTAGRWATLTEAQRAAWNTAALQHKTKMRLGQTGPMTGFQFFTKINATLAQFGQDQVDAPPGRPNFPALAPQNLVITNTTGVIALKLTCPADPGQNTIIRASAPVSQGINRVPFTRIIGMCPAPAAGSANITSLYTAVFGVPAVGSKVFVEANMLLDGWESPRWAWNAIVPTSA
jgi:hypothetical protein